MLIIKYKAVSVIHAVWSLFWEWISMGYLKHVFQYEEAGEYALNGPKNLSWYKAIRRHACLIW